MITRCRFTCSNLQQQDHLVDLYESLTQNTAERCLLHLNEFYASRPQLERFGERKGSPHLRAKAQSDSLANLHSLAETVSVPEGSFPFCPGGYMLRTSVVDPHLPGEVLLSYGGYVQPTDPTASIGVWCKHFGPKSVIRSILYV